MRGGRSGAPWQPWCLRRRFPGLAQQAKPIALVPIEGVSISGGLNVTNGQASIVNSGSVTAGDRTAHLALSRGGEVRLCSTTTLNLSKDSTATDSSSSALMMSLDRGAIEATYVAGRFSDVLLTPDLRVFISGPGQVDLKIRVNAQGDTCVDNHGANGPYVTVSSLLEGGLYRVQANQRVLFEHGSLHDVVDHEQEPCGCPPAPIVSVASTGTGGGKAAAPGQVIGGPSSTPDDTAFPLAQSEGLAPTPKVADPAQAAQVHARVNVPLVYNGDAPPQTPPKPQSVPRPIPSYDTEDPVLVADLKPAPTLPAPAGALVPHTNPAPVVAPPPQPPRPILAPPLQRPAVQPAVPHIVPSAIANRPTNLATTSQPVGATLSASAPGTVAPRMTIARPPMNMATNSPSVGATIPSAAPGTVAPLTTIVRPPVRIATTAPGLGTTIPSSTPVTLSPAARSVQPLPARTPAPVPVNTASTARVNTPAVWPAPVVNRPAANTPTTAAKTALPPFPTPTPAEPKPAQPKPASPKPAATSTRPARTAAVTSPTLPRSEPTATAVAQAAPVAAPSAAPAPKAAKAAQPQRQPIPAVLHRIGHFFSRLFSQ